MIYSVIGTDQEERKKAFKAILKDKHPTYYVQKEMFFQVPALIDAQDLFGGEVIVMLEQIGTDASGRDALKKLLPLMKASQNIFIIDEPFIEASFAKTLTTYSEALYDAKEEKVKKGFPTAFLSAIEKRDKKTAWVEWMKLRDEEAELTHGALWWKIKMIWQQIVQGRHSAFSEGEIAKIGYALVSGSHKAHAGKADLKDEIEKIVLSL